MTSFNGPWSRDLDALKKSVQAMPKEYRSAFTTASQDALERVCDAGVLHVWETDSDMDGLLQLTSVIAKLCDLGDEKETKNSEGRMVIIAEENGGRDNFKRVCELVEYLTGGDGKTHLEGTVCAFGGIVVVRGWNNALSSGGKEAEKTVKRINTAIERVFKLGGLKRKKIIWHHGPVVHFLLHWINSTTPTLRNALDAITITNALDLSTGVAPSTPGKSNTLSHLQHLEQYAQKLDIPVVFLDPASQLITLPYLATYMYFFAYYINTFFPPSLSRPHLHKAYDSLVTFAFRLHGASTATYGAELAKTVKAHLNASTARPWAKSCIDSASYTKQACRAAAQETKIHDAVQLADSPFAMFSQTNTGPAAFSRLAVGPASPVSASLYTAAPVQISFSDARLRTSSSATFYILIPSTSPSPPSSPHADPNDALEKSTSRIQGLMMGVLERVRQTKGMPAISPSSRSGWKEVAKACSWAIRGCDKMPKGVGEKVKFVVEKFTKGTWGHVLGAPGGDGKAGGVAGGVMGAGGGYTSEAAKNYITQRMMGTGYGMHGQPQGLQGGDMNPAAYAQYGQSIPPPGFPQAQPQGHPPHAHAHAHTHGHAHAFPPPTFSQPQPHPHITNFAPPPQQQPMHHQPVSAEYPQSVGLQSMGGRW